MVNPTNISPEDLARRLAEREADLREARRQVAEAISPRRAELAETRRQLHEAYAALADESKTLQVFHCRVADALAYCRRHAHSGVNLAAHTYLNRVIEILEGNDK